MDTRAIAVALVGAAALLPLLVQAEGASSVTTVATGTGRQDLYATAMDGKFGLAVGANGGVRETKDGGKSWSQVPFNGKEALLGVSLKAGRAVVVGQNGAIFLRATDGSWTKAQSGTDARLFGISINSRGDAVAVGSFGTIIKSTDGGKTWQPAPANWSDYAENGEEPHLYDAFVDEAGVATVIGEFGLILRSTPEDASWRALHRGEESLFALDLQPSGIGYAVGQSGAVVTTKDAGQTWQKIDVGTKAILLGVRVMDERRVLITALREAVESRDGGATWKALTAPEVTKNWMLGVAESESGSALLVGQSGRIALVGK